ncbi:MAG: hypothetical protein JWO22_3093 [Frankiales bacterium]|nr:hypothetical protein [Frankiales bacterium]
MIRAVPYLEALGLAEAMSDEMKALYEDDEGATPVRPEAFDRPGTFLVLSADGTDIGCGGLALIERAIGEVKRMYVVPDRRGQGHSRTLLRALVDHARGQRLVEIWLETGSRQTAAVALYESEGFTPIPAYGYWKDHPETRCFHLVL